MPKLQPEYDSLQDVPAGFESAYTEREGKAIFAGGEYEFVGADEYKKVHSAKQKAFEDYHGLKNQLKMFEGLDPEQYKTMAEELDVLRAKVKNGGDEETLAAIVGPRVKRETEKLNKQLEETLKELEGLRGYKNQTEKSQLLSKALGEHVSKDALVDAQIIMDMAIERQADGEYRSNGKAGFESGLTVEELVLKALESRPHWKKQSQPGHGAGGSGGAGGVKTTSRFAELTQKVAEGKATPAEKNEMMKLASHLAAEQRQRK